MNSHKNAPLTPVGRLRMVRRALQSTASDAEVAREFGVSLTTLRKWKRRYREGGEAGLVDRSSRPLSRHPKAISEFRQRRIKVLRKRRWTTERIARRLHISPATVARYLKAMGMNRLALLEPPAAPHRYERDEPGSLIHMDIKKLGCFYQPGHRVTSNRRVDSRGAGWEFVHVCIDDHSRVSYSEIFPDERKESVMAFTRRALVYFESLGITVKQLMTDNGSAYRSAVFAKQLGAKNIRHLFTKPYTPRTNGKAERFIQTLLREWAYARSYRTSLQRARALPAFLHDYNWHRPHGSLDYRSPISRLTLDDNNLMRLHI